MKRVDRIFGDMPVWSVSAGQWGLIRHGMFVPLGITDPHEPKPQIAPMTGPRQEPEKNTNK